MPPPTSPPPFTLDAGTGLSLALAFSFMPAAQIAAAWALPKTISRKYYFLFLWGAYDFLNHAILEASFLYHCFFSYETISLSSDYPHPASLGNSKGPYFLGYSDRNYGPYYSDAPMARLWQEYAKADSRWGGADLTVISLELLTVFLAGPAAIYICYLITKLSNTTDAVLRARLDGRLWIVAIALSTGELYGGFMTFAPEWLSANSSLAGDHPVYLWLYLVFFNMLWVFIPAWICYEGYFRVTNAFVTAARVQQAKKVK